MIRVPRLARLRMRHTISLCSGGQKNRFFKRALLLDIASQREAVEKHLALAETLFPGDDRVELLRARLQSQ